MGNNGSYFKLILRGPFKGDERTVEEKNMCNKQPLIHLSILWSDSMLVLYRIQWGDHTPHPYRLAWCSAVMVIASVASTRKLKKKNKRKDFLEWQVSQDSRDHIRLLPNQVHLKNSPCHDALFSPVTRYGRSQVCCRQKILVKGLSRLIGRFFNLFPKHGRTVKSCCCIPLVDALSALGRGSEWGHGQAGPCSSWTPPAPGWGTAMRQSQWLLEPFRMCQEGRPLWWTISVAGRGRRPWHRTNRHATVRSCHHHPMHTSGGPWARLCRDASFWSFLQTRNSWHRSSPLQLHTRTADKAAENINNSGPLGGD